MPESKKQVNFFWIATGIILLTALVITLHWPEITAWRRQKIDSLLTTASQQNSDQSRYSYLQQAQILDSKDPLATQAIAEFWMNRGDVDKAISVYQTGVDTPNYVYLGNLALQAQNYQLALQYFQKANRGDSSANGLIGEAAAYYNLDNITEGCNKAVQASKSNLSSEPAKNLLKSCSILGGDNAEATQLIGTTPLSERQTAYILLDAKVYKEAEQKLTAIQQKTAGDYLVLARLIAARGGIGEAAKLAEEGIALDRSNSQLNKDLVRYYSILGENSKKELYQNRLNQLDTLEQIR